MFGKPALVKIEANLTWKVARDPQSGAFIGVCEPLNLNAIGDTFEEFQEAANEAMALLLEDLFAENELNEFLRNQGWQLLNELPPPGSRVPRFDVPFDIDRTELSELMASA